METVRCRGIHKDFGDGDARIEVLRGVDLRVRLGEMLFLVGPSGSGKTTLISVIAGLLTASAGDLTVLGRHYADVPSQERIRFRRQNLGFVFQQFHLLPALTAAENAAVPLLAAGMPRRTAVAAAEELLAELGLAKRAHALPAQLSGGQQQRVAIARALIHEPHLVLCDEPTAALEAPDALFTLDDRHLRAALALHQGRLGRARARVRTAEAMLADARERLQFAERVQNPLAISAVPARYSESGVHASAGTSLAEWWRVFHDAPLDRLVERVIDANLDLRIAESRVREARALRGVVRSALWPTVDGGAAHSRTRQSENGPLDGAVRRGLVPLETDLYEAALDASWEIDIFGGTRRAVESAEAEIGAAEEARRDVLVSLLGEVGSSYMELRALQQELAVTQANMKAQEQTLALTRDRVQAGLATELDVTRAQAQVATTRAQIPSLTSAIQRAVHRLSVLASLQAIWPGRGSRRCRFPRDPPTSPPVLPRISCGAGRTSAAPSASWPRPWPGSASPRPICSRVSP